MTPPNGFLNYPANKPSKDGYYLVTVKSQLINKLGLQPSPSQLIVKFNCVSNEWTSILGMTSMGVGNIEKDVISWMELPQP